MKKIFILVSVLFVSITLIACNDTTSGGIQLPELLGESDVTIEAGLTWEDPGLSNYVNEYEVEGSVDVNTIGDYEITYVVLVDGERVVIERTIRVVDTTTPVVTINGSNMTINKGDTFVDPGARSTDSFEGNLTSTITISSNLDVNTAGEYLITYKSIDSSGNEGVATRTVTVVENTLTTNNAPVITINGASEITILVGEAYTDAGATAIDTEDGTLTDDLVVVSDVDTATVGVYTVTYNVSDSEGKEATTVTRTVNVVSNLKPVITLIGDAVVTINVGSIYTDAGANAVDGEDGQLTDELVVVSDVDTSTVGVYTVTYNVFDSQGLSAITVTRTVNVIANAIPVITLVGEDTIAIMVGSTFVDPGFTAFDEEDGNFESEVIVSGSVDTSIAAVYIITYSYTDNDNNEVRVVRVVTVTATTSTVPVITLNGDRNIYISTTDEYVDLGVSVMDTEDGDLTSSVVITFSDDYNLAVVGNYTITYTVTDSDSNTVSVVRNISVERTTNVVPELFVDSEDVITYLTNETYYDPTFTARDFEDGNITRLVSKVLSENFDHSVAGTYTIIYSVTDSDDNTVSRTITVIFKNDDEAPVVSLIGLDEMLLVQGIAYTEEGVSAIDAEDGDISNSVVITGTVDFNVLGIYVLTYTVTDSNGAEVVLTREVTVVDVNDTSPVLTLFNEGAGEINQGATYFAPGYSAWDDQEGDVTDKVVVVGLDSIDTSIVGTYWISYQITDNNYNYVEVSRPLTVVAFANDDPTIGLWGDAIVLMREGQEYVELGAAAHDAQDGTISDQVVISGEVDDHTPGIYTLTYTITDLNGGTASITRKVYVIYNKVPELNVIGDEVVYVNVFDSWVDPGAIANDYEDGPLNSKIEINSDVNFNVPGEYTVTYSVRDTNGKTGYVYRTIVVVNNIAGDYGTVVIEKDLDLNFNDVIDDLGLTGSITEVDTSVLGDTFVLIDGYGVLFRVFENNFDTVCVTPGTLFYTPSYNNFEARVAVYEQQLIAVSGYQNVSYFFDFGLGFGDTIISSKSTIPNGVEAIVEAGIFYAYFAVYGEADGYLTFSIDKYDVVDESSIGIKINEFTSIYETEKEQALNFTAPGGDLEIVISNYGISLLTIKDQSGNIIIQRRIEDGFNLIQNFAAGEYEIILKSYFEPTPLQVFITSNIQDNYGYIYAEEVNVGTENVITIVPGREWFKFEIVEAGDYVYDVLYSSENYLSFKAYDSSFNVLTTNNSSLSLDAGTYYLEYDLDYGYTSFIICKVVEETVEQPTYDTMIESGYSELFEINADVAGRWYQFTLEEDNLVYFGENVIDELSAYGLISDSDGSSIYIDLYNVIDHGQSLYGEYHSDEYVMLSAGTYRAYAYSNQEGTYNFSFTTYDVEEGSTDRNYPIDINANEVFVGYVDAFVPQYFRLNFCHEGTYEFIYNGESRNFTITDDGGIVFDENLWGATSGYITMEEGRKSIKLSGSSEDGIYTLELVKLENSATGFSFEKESAPMFDPYKLQYAYTSTEGVSVFQKMKFDEDIAYYAYPENVRSIIVYDNDGDVYASGDIWDLMDLFFVAGIYTFEYVSDDSGFIYLPEVWTELMYDYDNPTVIENYHDINGFIGEDKVDMFEFVLTEETLLSIEFWEELDITILDSDKTMLKDMNYDYEIPILLEAGTYYIVINKESGFYSVFLSNLNDQVLPTDSSSAKQVYIEEEFDFYIKDIYSVGYVTFESDAESVVIYENMSRYGLDVSYIVYDSNMVEMPEGRVGIGTYYIKFYTYGIDLYDIEGPVQVNFKIKDIDGFVGHNTKGTAIEIQNGYTQGYSPWYLSENWYTFNVSEDELVSFEWNDSETEINYEILDSNGNSVVLDAGLTQYPVGNYYIRIYHTTTERLEMLVLYQFEFNKVEYVDVSDDCANLETIDLTSGETNLRGYLLTNSDRDCYKLSVSDPYYLYFQMGSGYEVYQVDENGNTIKRIYPYSNYYEEDVDYIYIMVKTKSNYGPCDYSITIKSRTDMFVGSTMDSAKTVGLGLYNNAIVFSDTEEDYFKLTVYEVVEYAVDGPSYVILDESGEVYLSDNLLPGTYYVVITPGYATNYEFRIYEIIESDEGEGKEEYDYLINTYNSPIELAEEFFTLDQEKTESKYSYDYYQFEVKGSGSLYSVSEEGFGSHVTIKDSNDYTVTAFTLFDDAEVFYLSAGVYTVAIGDSYGYSISFEELDYITYSDNSENPTMIDLYENIHSYILDPSTRNYFEFTLEEDRVIEFYGGMADGMYDYDIIDSEGNSVRSSYQNSILFLAEGTYQVVIYGSFEMTLINYEFRIVALHDVITNTVKEDAAIIEIRDEYSWFYFYSDEDDVYAKIVLDRDSFLELSLYLSLENEDGVIIDSDELIPAGTYIVTYLNGNGYSSYTIRDNTDYVIDGTEVLYQNKLYTVYSDDRYEADTFIYTPYNDQMLVLSKMVGYGFTVEVFDEDGSRVSYQNVGTNGVNEHSVYLEGGVEYTFEITGIYGFYQFEYTVYTQEDPIMVSDLDDIADGEDVFVVGIVTAILPDYGFVLQDVDTGESIFVALDLENVAIGMRMVVRGVIITNNTESQSRIIVVAKFVRVDSFNNTIIKSTETNPSVISDEYLDRQSYVTDLTIKGFDFDGYVVFTGSSNMDLMFQYTVFAPYMQDVYSIGDTISLEFTVLDVHRSTVRIIPTLLPELSDLQKAMAAGGRITFDTVVDSDLTFPLVDDDYGVNFTWTTNYINVISTTGVVTRPAIGENDIVVRITLSSSYGDQTVQYTWDVTVLQLRAPIIGTYEEFETFNDNNAAFHDGSFTGVDSLDWTFKGMTAYTDGSYTIGGSGTSLMFGDSTDTRELTVTVLNGLSDLSIDLLSGIGTFGPGSRSIEIFVNGVSVGEYNLTENNTVESFKIYDIDISGECIIKIVATGAYTIVVDNFLWSDYSE